MSHTGIIKFENGTGLPLVRDALGEWRYANPISRRRRKFYRWVIWKVKLVWNEGNSWARIEVWPRCINDLPLLRPRELVLEALASNEPWHTTVKLRDQILTPAQQLDLEHIRGFFSAGGSIQDVWWTSTLIKYVSGFHEEGGFVASIASGGSLTPIEAQVRRLRAPHRGPGNLTISL